MNRETQRQTEPQSERLERETGRESEGKQRAAYVVVVGALPLDFLVTLAVRILQRRDKCLCIDVALEDNPEGGGKRDT